jgi:GT2 family glycosyltransferase
MAAEVGTAGVTVALAEDRSATVADVYASVSVVIVNFNAIETIVECVRRALTQAREVIVVDNASTDNSMLRLSTRFAGEPRLVLLANRTNLGFSTACNLGADAAREDNLLFLNPDCVLMDGAVRRLMRALRADPLAGMVGGRLVNTDGSEQGGGRRAVPTPWRSFVRAFGLARLANRWPRLFHDFYLHTEPLPDRPIQVEAISGACMLTPRYALTRVGPLDEGYFLHCEDLDWCMRYRIAGMHVLFVPDAVVVHSKGVSSQGRPIFVEWHKHRGMIRFYRKFFRRQYPGALMWLVAVGVWLRFGALAVYYGGRRAAMRLRHGLD